MGNKTTASGESSTSFGYNTQAMEQSTTAMGENIQVNRSNVLGNGGDMFGHELYSKSFSAAGSVSEDVYLSDLSSLQIFKSDNNVKSQPQYVISPTDMATNKYFDTNMISEYDEDSGSGGGWDSTNSVNITQLVYTLVGAVKVLQNKVAALESSNSI
jgi:hypothetical protein